jgi:hypothetical protein
MSLGKGKLKEGKAMGSGFSCGFTAHEISTRSLLHWRELSTERADVLTLGGRNFSVTLEGCNRAEFSQAINTEMAEF